MIGQGTVEFAMVALFALFPMIFGTIELGRAVWYYNQLSQLSREGARWLVVTTVHQTYHQNGNRPGTYNLGTCACPNTAVGHMAAMENGMDANEVDAVIQQLNGTIPSSPPYGFTYGREIRVQLTYDYRPVVSSLINIPATITMRAETTMRLQ